MEVQLGEVQVLKVRTDQIYRTPRLALNVSLVRFVPMIPRFVSYAVSLLAIAFLISGCASRDEGVVEESTSPEATMQGNRPVFTPGSSSRTEHGF